MRQKEGGHVMTYALEVKMRQNSMHSISLYFLFEMAIRYLFFSSPKDQSVLEFLHPQCERNFVAVRNSEK